MVHKIVTVVCVFVFMASLMAGCAKEEETIPDVQFTAETLAQYNGKDGQPAYIAVNGLVYDVTNHKSWKNGEHHGFSAGQDLTDAFQEEHRAAVLRKLPVMGTTMDE